MKGDKGLNFVDTDPRVPLMWDRSRGEVADVSKAILHIETTNLCGDQCEFCSHHLLRRPKGVMDAELFKSIIDQAVKAGVRKVVLSGFGEPLCDPQLPSRIEYARGKGIRDIGITTNGLALTYDLFTVLCVAGLSRMHLSLAPLREYEQTRPKADARKLFSMVRELKDHPSRSIIRINYVDTGISTAAELEQWEDWLKGLGLRLDHRLLKHNWNWRGGDDPFLHVGPKESAKVVQYLCEDIYHPQVAWDGEMKRCAVDQECEIKIGNLKEMSLQEAFNSPTMREIRRRQFKGQMLDRCLTCSLQSTTVELGEVTTLRLSSIPRYMWRYVFDHKSIGKSLPSLPQAAMIGLRWLGRISRCCRR